MMRSVALASLASLAAAAHIQVDTASMWAELKQHCDAGLCSTAEGSKMRDIHNSTDCHGRMLAYEYALTIVPARAPQLETFDGLNLETTCGVTRPTHLGKAPHAAVPDHRASAELTFHVHPTLGDDAANSGTEARPFLTIHRALAATRTVPQRTAPAAVVLEAGVHYLNATIDVLETDAGLTITAASGAEGKAIVSGGVLLKPTWTKSTRATANASANIWVTDPADIVEIRGLQTLAPHRRVTRAREPNADTDGSQGAELCTGCFHGGVKRWHQNTDCVGKAKTVYMDLRE